MKLKELASLLLLSRLEGDGDTEVHSIETDSRHAGPGDLFICLPGHKLDGHDYAEEAVKKGAVAIVAEKPVEVDVPVLYVKDSRYAMAAISAHFYGYPAEDLSLIGVTGTNGKTTVTYLIEKILSDFGKSTALMGTIEMKIGGQSYEVKNTTQDALQLQKAFRHMKEAGEQYCVMEVSSHALQLGRVKGCNFRTAVFTNLTQDHLDFHQSMDRYRDAKSLLFSRMGNSFTPDPERRKFAVLNADDPASKHFRAVTASEVITYGIDEEADVRAKDITIGAQGTRFVVDSFSGQMEFRLKLIGKFSVYNALAAITAALAEGVPLTSIRNTLEDVKGIPGRFESVDEGQDFLVIVDYAHTPDGLENVLKTISGFAEGKVYCVFGCGGDRDRAKRPIMGEIAAKYSDYLYITSDNPRTEEPEPILYDIEAGVASTGMSRDGYECIVDRKLAIEKAVEVASPKDVVLIAGKGHETYHEINGVRYDFDDREVARKAIRSKKQ